MTKYADKIYSHILPFEQVHVEDIYNFISKIESPCILLLSILQRSIFVGNTILIEN